MNFEKLREEWLAEERAAHIRGWDFSHINARYKEEENLPWDYETVIHEFLHPEHKLLDIATGGGEFLLALHHPHENTAASEGYPPNVELCKEVLLPLGVDFKQAGDPARLPFADGEFDVVVNRHGNFDPTEIFRILKPGGVFITQQVGAHNDRELVELLLPGTPLPFPEQELGIAQEKFARAGFEILRGEEAYPNIEFYDVGALVWFARIIEWEFPDFSVESCFENLCKAQEMLQRDGAVTASTHRFLLVAHKTL